MRGSYRLFLSATVCVAIAAISCAPCWAGIAVVDQSRSVSTVGPNLNQTDTATPFATFNDTLNKSGTFTNNSGNVLNFTEVASQNSSVNLSGSSLHISATGNISFTLTGGLIQAPASPVAVTSAYSVTFNLTSPATYKVVEQTDHQTLPPPGNADQEAQSDGAQLLFNGTQNIITFPLFLGDTGQGPAPVTFTGTLAPGTYIFNGKATGGDDATATGSADFSADLTVNATGSQAVPLPPALWMALLTMVGVLPAIYMLRRRTDAA